MKTLYLLRGLPGCGKSTLAKSLSNSMTGHVEADMFFVDDDGSYNFDGSKLKDAHAWCQKQAEDFMSLYEYETVIVSNTFTQEWEMTPYLEMAERYGYIVFSLIVENRHGGVNEHGVPEEALERMEKRFELKLR